MEILVDGTLQEMQPLPRTMGKLVSDLKNAVANAGKVVVNVEIDGRSMDAARERELAEKPVESFGSVSVVTAEPRALCLATLEEVGRHVQPILDECARIADLIDTGKEENALSRIPPCLEVWGAMLGAVHKIATLMQIDIGEVSTEEESLPECISALIEFLQSLKGSIDAHDMVTVRDAMKHEMPEVASRISLQLAALSSKIAPE